MLSRMMLSVIFWAKRLGKYLGVIGSKPFGIWTASYLSPAIYAEQALNALDVSTEIFGYHLKSVLMCMFRLEGRDTTS